MITHSTWGVQRVLTQCVLIPEDGEPSIRPPEDLHSETRPVVKSPVRLPSVHKPRLDLQVLCGKNLHANAVEKPRRVRGNIRRLISPVVELVVAAQADVRHEDSCVDVNS